MVLCILQRLHGLPINTSLDCVINIYNEGVLNSGSVYIAEASRSAHQHKP